MDSYATRRRRAGGASRGRAQRRCGPAADDLAAPPDRDRQPARRTRPGSCRAAPRRNGTLRARPPRSGGAELALAGARAAPTRAPVVAQRRRRRFVARRARDIDGERQPLQRGAHRPDGGEPDPRPPRGADAGVDRQARPHGDRGRRQPVRPDPLRLPRAAADGARRSPGCSCRCCASRSATRASSRRAATRCAASSTASPRSPTPSTSSTTARARSSCAGAKLVEEIVEGDFDQIELYAAKLAELERFIAEQTEGEVEKTGAASVARRRRNRSCASSSATCCSCRRRSSRCSCRPTCSTSWRRSGARRSCSAARRDGADSDRAQRYRRVGADLVMSVQPKGSPMFRKKFLMQLPPLMKDLNEGMRLIGWPEAAQKEFFGKLLPAHAESLKGQAAVRARPQPDGQAARGRVRDAGAGERELPRTDAGARSRARGHRAPLHARRSEAGRPGQRGRGRLVGAGREQRARSTSTSASKRSRRCRPRPRSSASSMRRRSTATLGPTTTSDEPAEPIARAAADRSRQARLRLPDAPEGRVAEGPARARQLGPRLLRLHARRQAPGNDLDDVAHAGADVRDRALPRDGERLPDGARDAARAGSSSPSSARRPGTERPGRPAVRGRRACAPCAPRRRSSKDRRGRVPAMSNAVPWSGLVRTNGRPSVTFTPCSTPRYFTGIRPWSWVIATTTSNSPGWPGALRARMKTVSGANGPLASMPFGARGRDRRRDDAQLLVAEEAALAGMRIEAGDGDPRRGLTRARRRCGGDADRLEHGVEGHRVDRACAATGGSSPARCSARRWPASCAPAAARRRRRRAPAASRCGRENRRRRPRTPPCGSAP